MPSPSITFRTGPDLAAALAARVEAGANVTGAVAQEQLSRYFAFLAAQLASVRLTRDQALCLADIMRGTLIDRTWYRDPGRLMSFEIEDAAPDGYGEKWGVDLTELAKLCSSWTAGQGLAVLDAIERFRKTDTTDYDSALITVGLLRDGPQEL